MRRFSSAVKRRNSAKCVSISISGISPLPCSPEVVLANFHRVLQWTAPMQITRETGDFVCGDQLMQPAGKLPLKKRPLELDSKSALRMWDECFLFTLGKQRKKRKNRKGDQTEAKSSGFYKSFIWNDLWCIKRLRHLEHPKIFSRLKLFPIRKIWTQKWRIWPLSHKRKKLAQTVIFGVCTFKMAPCGTTVILPVFCLAPSSWSPLCQYGRDTTCYRFKVLS